MQKQYPERLERLFIYEAPTVFWALWSMVWPFLAVSTREKVQLVSGDAGLKAIHCMVSSTILPSSLGGSADLKPFAEAVKSLVGGKGQQSVPSQPHNRADAANAQHAASHARSSSIADSLRSDATVL
jgi:hypothetical protein